MQKLGTLLSICLFVGGGLFAQEMAVAADAPSVEEIAEQYIEVIGGAEAWKEIKSMRFTGTASMQGMEFPFVVTMTEGNKFRNEVDIQGSKMVQAFNGETAWMLFPLQGIDEPTAMSEEDAADMLNDRFLDPFIDHAERGFTLEAVPGKEIEGTPTYGVRVTDEGGFDKTYYFDTENMVPIMVSTVSKGGQTKGMSIDNYLSDYQDLDGLMVPMFTEVKINGNSAQKLTMSEGEMNPEVDAAIFEIKE